MKRRGCDLQRATFWKFPERAGCEETASCEHCTASDLREFKDYNKNESY